MWTLIEIFYRKYCLARMQEMRRYELSIERWGVRRDILLPAPF
jgi:hypothetical protein